MQNWVQLLKAADTFYIDICPWKFERITAGAFKNICIAFKDKQIAM